MLYLVNHSPHATEEDDCFCKVPDNFFWSSSFSKPAPMPLHSMINLILQPVSNTSADVLPYSGMIIHSSQRTAGCATSLTPATCLAAALTLAQHNIWGRKHFSCPAWSTTAQISSQEAKLRIRKIISSWAYRQLKPWSLLIIVISQTLSVTNMFRVHRGKGWRFKSMDFKARRMIVSSFPSQCIIF